MRRCLDFLGGLARRPRRLLLLGLLLVPLGFGAWVGGRHLWAEYHFWKAKRALERYYPEEAREHLRLCLEVWPESVPTRLLAARAARQAGDLEAAEEHLEVCDRFPEEMSEETVLEAMLLQAEGGNLDPVEEQLQDLVEQNHAQALLILEALTRGYLRMYRLVEANSCLSYWLRQQPDNVQALTLRGRVWMRVHDYRRAVRDFRRVLELDPERDAARLFLANCLLENSKTRDALKELRYLRDRQPDNPEVLVRLAFALNKQGRVGEAQAILARLVADQPDYGPALKGMGQLALQAGRTAEAEDWLRKAVASDPYDRQSNFLLYRCLDERGQKTAARKQRRKLKAIETGLERVIEIGNRLMPMNPHDPALHAELGTILLRLGREELGVAWLRSALAQDENYAPAHQALAAYFRRRGQPGDAARAARHRRLARAGRVDRLPRSAGPVVE
jgi:tetratricopeptide (TPR) repeat protein